MQIRHRPMPLNHTQRSMMAGGKPDPRKGPKETRGNHSPKMRRDPKPTLYNHEGYTYSTVLEERVKAAAESVPSPVTIKSGKETFKIPYRRYGRESAKLRAKGIQAPFGCDVAPGQTITL